MAEAYEFRIAGRLSAELLDTFEPSRTRADGQDTVFLRMVADDGELFGVIGRCETYGLRLLSLHRVAGSGQSPVAESI